MQVKMPIFTGHVRQVRSLFSFGKVSRGLQQIQEDATAAPTVCTKFGGLCQSKAPPSYLRSFCGCRCPNHQGDLCLKRSTQRSVWEGQGAGECRPAWHFMNDLGTSTPSSMLPCMDRMFMAHGTHGSPRPSQAQEVEASVSGSIPEWIQGSFLANGGADFTGETTNLPNHYVMTSLYLAFVHVNLFLTSHPALHPPGSRKLQIIGPRHV